MEIFFGEEDCLELKHILVLFMETIPIPQMNNSLIGDQRGIWPAGKKIAILRPRHTRSWFEQ